MSVCLCSRVCLIRVLEGQGGFDLAFGGVDSNRDGDTEMSRDNGEIKRQYVKSMMLFKELECIACLLIMGLAYIIRNGLGRVEEKVQMLPDGLFGCGVKEVRETRLGRQMR